MRRNAINHRLWQMQAFVRLAQDLVVFDKFNPKDLVVSDKNSSKDLVVSDICCIFAADMNPIAGTFHTQIHYGNRLQT